MNCSICGQPATVVDLDRDEAYCEAHGEERFVCAGNHEHLPPEEAQP